MSPILGYVGVCLVAFGIFLLLRRIYKLQEEVHFWKLQYDVTKTTFETYRRLVNEGVEKEIREGLADSLKSFETDPINVTD